MAKNESKPETGEKMVTVRLYMGDTKESKLPVDVWINGRKFTIPRGKDVEVPEYVAACLNDSETAKLEELKYNEDNAWTEN